MKYSANATSPRKLSLEMLEARRVLANTLPTVLNTASGYAFEFPADTGDLVNDTISYNLNIGDGGAEFDAVYFAPQHLRTYQFDVRTPRSNVDPVVAVYHADTGQLIGSDDNSGFGNDARLSLTLVGEQRYIIAVADEGADTTGAVDLQITTDLTNFVQNVHLDAHGDAFVASVINDPQEVHAFQFVAPSSAIGVTASLVGTPLSFDPTLVLWDSSGNVLRRSDTRFGENATVGIVEPGATYYATVFSKNYATQGAYDLSINFSQSSLPLTHPIVEGYAYAFNHGSGNQVNNTISRQINLGFSTDYDATYFAPDNSGNHTFRLTESPGSGGIDPVLAIYDADTGERLAVDNNSGAGRRRSVDYGAESAQAIHCGCGGYGVQFSGWPRSFYYFEYIIHCNRGRA